MEKRVFYRIEGTPPKCIAVEFVSTDEYADGRRWLDPRTGNVIPSGGCLGYCDTAEAAWDVAVNVAEQHERETHAAWDDACRLHGQVRTARLMALSVPLPAAPRDESRFYALGRCPTCGVAQAGGVYESLEEAKDRAEMFRSHGYAETFGLLMPEVSMTIGPACNCDENREEAE